MNPKKIPYLRKAFIIAFMVNNGNGKIKFDKIPY